MAFEDTKQIISQGCRAVLTLRRESCEVNLRNLRSKVVELRNFRLLC